MTPEETARNLRSVAEKHKRDVVHTFETNISHMATDAADTIDTLLKRFAWIPITERMPESPDYDWVLVKSVFVPEGGEGVPHIAELRNGVWYCDCFDGPMEETLSIKVVAWFDMQLIL